MSARLRRQELRRAKAHTEEDSQNAAPIAEKVKIKRARRNGRSEKAAFLVTTQEDGTTVQSNDLGLPTREQYALLAEDYIRSLSPRKREKALLSQQMFDHVWDVLHDPEACKVGTPQFRWWVRKMFVLAYTAPNGADADLKPVVMHEDRPVVIRDQIYDVLSYCHLLANHGGRDRTTSIVRQHYSWVPKELVARFVKTCPTCIFKRTGDLDEATLPSDCTNTAPSAPSTPAISQTSLLTESAAASSHFTSPSYIVSPLRSLPTTNAAPFNSAQVDTYYAQAHYDAAKWLSSLASQPGPSHSAPLSRVDSALAEQVFAIPDAPSLNSAHIKLEYFGGSDKAPRNQDVLAIDPALLSEDANISSLRSINSQITRDKTSRSDRPDTVLPVEPKLRDYMFVPPLGRCTIEGED